MSRCAQGVVTSRRGAATTSIDMGVVILKRRGSPTCRSSIGGRTGGRVVGGLSFKTYN